MEHKQEQQSKPFMLLHDIVKSICKSNDVAMETTESNNGTTYITFTIPQAKMKYAIGMGGRTKNALTRIARAMCSRQDVILTLLAKQEQRQQEQQGQQRRKTNDTRATEEDFS